MYVRDGTEAGRLRGPIVARRVAVDLHLGPAMSLCDRVRCSLFRPWTGSVWWKASRENAAASYLPWAREMARTSTSSADGRGPPWGIGFVFEQGT